MDEKQVLAEQPNAGDNMQIDFLQYLESLNGVPQVIANINNDSSDTASAKEDGLFMETDISMPLTDEQLMQSLMDPTPDPEAAKEPTPAIPQITISVPEGQFLNGELDPQLAAAEFTISFNDLKAVAVGALPAPAPIEEMDISLCTAAELQQVQLALLKHNFVQKLHLAASSQLVTFLNWSSQGQHLQLDYMGLQEHLSGTQSMFRCLNVQHFTRQLLDIGFKRIEQPSQPSLEERPQLYYVHENFQAEQTEQLLLLPTPKWELATTPDAATKTYSALQLARSRFQTLLLYHNDVRLLQQEEPSAEQLVPRRGRICSNRQPTQLLTSELAPKHVNPRETVLESDVGPKAEYAGFYGGAEPALIAEFFAEYLPRFGNNHNSGYKDIVVDTSKVNSFQQNLPIGVEFSEDEEEPPLDNQKCEETTSTTTVEEKTEDMPAAEPETPLSEDFELEQVMQELCGVTTETEENPTDKEKLEERAKELTKGLDNELTQQLDKESTSASAKELDKKRIQTTVMSPTFKIKRKKMSRNSTNADQDTEFETASLSENDEQHDENNKKNLKVARCKTSPKKEVKRRRYDLRKSKAKRSI